MTRKKMQKVYEDSERTVWDHKPDGKQTGLSKEIERLTQENEILRKLADSLLDETKSLLREIANNHANSYTIVLARLATAPTVPVSLRTHFWKKLVAQIWGEQHPRESIK